LSAAERETVLGQLGVTEAPQKLGRRGSAPVRTKSCILTRRSAVQAVLSSRRGGARIAAALAM